MDIHIKRVYEPPSSDDGTRILVDRLWPRGVSKDKAAIDYWAKAIAPSNELRRWYNHEVDKWDEFKVRYFRELDANSDGVTELRVWLKSGPATFLFSSKELHLNNAHVLKEYLLSYGDKQ